MRLAVHREYQCNCADYRPTMTTKRSAEIFLSLSSVWAAVCSTSRLSHRLVNCERKPSARHTFEMITLHSAGSETDRCRWTRRRHRAPLWFVYGCCRQGKNHDCALFMMSHVPMWKSSNQPREMLPAVRSMTWTTCEKSNNLHLPPLRNRPSAPNAEYLRGPTGNISKRLD